jgi:hypothetical protein
MLGARLSSAAFALCLSLLLVPMAAAAVATKLPVPGEHLAWTGTAVAIDGDTAVVGAPRGGAHQGGEAYVYTRAADGAWSLKATLTAADASFGDNFGSAVAIDGDYIAVGAERHHYDSGAVYAFHLDHVTGEWAQYQKLASSHFDGFHGERFGHSLAMQDGLLAVGAPNGGQSSVGTVYLYADRGHHLYWARASGALGDLGRSGSRFGSSVDIDGSRLVVGAPGSSSAFVYSLESDDPYSITPTREGWLPPNWDEFVGSERFGASVAIDGDRVVVGAPGVDVEGRDDQGVAFVYERTPNSDDYNKWSEQARLIAADGAGDYDWGDEFGTAVDISGNRIAVGAPLAKVGDIEQAGAVYAFSMVGMAWVESGKEVAPGADAEPRLGRSVAIDGDHTIAGAPGVGPFPGSGSLGAAYAFHTPAPAPTTSLTAAEADPTADPTGDFQFASDDAAATFDCSLDGGAFTPCASPYATPALADGPHSLQVRAVDAAGNPDATPATHSWTVITKAPQSTVRPAVAGSTSVGDRLSSGTGSWSAPVSGYEYRWKRCAARCTTIAGTLDADDGNSTYTLTDADAGHSLYATVTATNVAGSASAASTRTATVGAPLNTQRPTVSGTAQSGHAVIASTGKWSPAAARYDYRWQRCAVTCTAISGTADADDGDSTYTLTSADFAHTIRAVVTATNAAGSATAYSARTQPVGLPVNTAPPVVSGTREVGKVLTSTPGHWTPAVDRHAYRWRRCTAAGCTDITGTPDADDGNSTYTLTSADAGHTIRSVVTATNAAGSTTAYSPRTTVVDLPISTLPPAITGTKQTGHTLTATTGKWTPQIDTYAYRWRRCTGTTAATCTDITGTPEGDNTYTLTAADTGHYIRVTVTATNRAGSTTAGASATGKIP